jgi:hypothetical protein
VLIINKLQSAATENGMELQERGVNVAVGMGERVEMVRVGMEFKNFKELAGRLGVLSLV